MNFIHARQFANTTSSAVLQSGTAGGQSGLFPSSNVTLFHKAYRSFRSSSALDIGGAIGGNTNRTYVGIDLGTDFASVNPIGAVVIINTNVTSGYVQSSTNGTAWSGTTLSTISRDPSDGMYKLYYAQNPPSGTSARYWRFNANTPSPSPVDGLTNLRVGSIVLVSTANLINWKVGAATYNASFPYGPTTIWPHITNADGVGGGRSPVITGNRGCQLVLTQPNMPASMKSVLDDLNDASPATPVMFYRNFPSSPIQTAEVYICWKVGSMEYPLDNAVMHNLRGVILEECV